MKPEERLTQHYSSLVDSLQRGYPGDQPGRSQILQAAAQITAAEIIAEAIKSLKPVPFRRPKG